MSFSCDDKETLVAYLYGECDEATSRLVEAHAAACAACAGELAGLGGVRMTLAAWAPPDRATGFKLVRDDAPGPAGATVLRPARWWQAPLPGWARAAAAVLLVAGGAAAANIEVRYDRDGLVVRTGWQRPVAVAGQAVPAPHVVPATAPAPDPWRADLDAVARQLRDEFHQQLAESRAGAPVQVRAASSLDEKRVLALLDGRLAETEQRWQNELAYRVSLAGRVSPGLGITQPMPSRVRPTTISNLFFSDPLKK
jgi:hypothetical protein